MKLYKTIEYTVEDGIAFLCLNQPPANTFSMLFFQELSDVVLNHLLKDTYEGLIIKSNGRHFSGGSDISELLDIVHKNKHNTIPALFLKNTGIFQIIYRLNKPTVALLKGVCYGSGFELALCTQYRLASPNTLICLPETTFGLIPGLGGIHAVACLAGHARAIEFILTGNALNAQDALTYRLIDKIVPKDELLNAGLDILKLNNMPLVK